jgi:transcriptional regulator with XRE-family HTH domain
MTLSALVRKLRLEAGLSLKDVERRAKGKISASYINHIENEMVKPSAVSIEKLQVLAKALGVDQKKLINAALSYTPPSEEEVSDLMYEAFGGEKVDIEVLKKAIELIKTMEKK